MPKDWKELSEAVSREQDPQKLLELVEELDQALEQRENELKEKRSPEENKPTQESNLRPMIPVTAVLSA